MTKVAVLRAVMISIAVHVALAWALVMVIAGGADNAPDSVVTLDIGSVELSISEEESDSDMIAQEPVSTEPLPPMPEELPSPENPAFDDAMPLPPPSPERTHTSEPEMEVSEMVTPVIAASQARIDTLPALKDTIKPVYPERARRRGETGTVALGISVDSSGVVAGVAVVISSGYRELDEAAIKAVKKARFNPATRDGEAVSAEVRLTLDFRLK